jgi:FkbM family methyltransferase
MSAKQWFRRLIDNALGRRGYVLTRATVSGTGWGPALKMALPVEPDRRALVLDIGANRGGFCEMVISEHPRADIYAFEPLPEMIEKLKAIPPGAHDLVILPFALGAKASDAQFNVHARIDSSSLLPSDPVYRELYPDQAAVTERIDIRIETLDAWAAQNGVAKERPVDLVKMDVQGYEGQVIAGGIDVLRSTRFLIVEAALYPSYAGGIMIDELCATLHGLGFELVWSFNVSGPSCDLFWKNKLLVDGPARAGLDAKFRL